MSRKGASTVCKSKQIPRIFQRRNQSACGVGRSAWNLESSPLDGVNENSIQQVSSHLLLEASDVEKPHYQDDGSKKAARNGITENIEYSSRSWNSQSVNASTTTTICEESVEKSSNAAETVADIEKWLKTRTESVSSIDLDTMKSEVEEDEEEEGERVGVERYLADDLPHVFLGKDSDGLSIDIDLSDKKLNLGYDPILQELHSDKLLDVCVKNDDFIPPEFQLDHLDPLTLSPEDMMVAGEILPSTSNQPSLETLVAKDPLSCNDVAADNQDSRDGESQERPDKPIQSDEFAERFEENSSNTREMGVSGMSNGKFVEFRNLKTRIKSCPTQGPKGKSKMEPRIMKRRSKLNDKGNNNGITLRGDECLIESRDGIMAMVAISTDNVSNMTQIVINTGKDEQIYQGKTSELIEATGNFPKLPRIDAPGSWNNGVDNGGENAPSTQNELIISNALAELGITEECLQPTITNEHGRTWLCPRDDCNREFNKVHALKGHLLAHYGVKPFKCDYEGCAWAFHSEYKVKRHKETHLKRKDFVCAVAGCDRRFTTVYNLFSHEKLHSRPNRITCQVPDCHEKFQTKRALELHMKSHDQSHAPHVCQHEGCGKRFYSGNALTSHQRCHSYTEVDVKCAWPGCGRVFDKPCRLKAHIRSHTGSKPYPCTYQDCQWAFSTSSKLRRHEKKHTNERKYVCNVDGCGKAFLRSEHLKEHILTHKEGKYFECYMCDARFSAKSSLYVHIKKHQVKEAVKTITPASSKPPKRKTKESQAKNDAELATRVVNNEQRMVELYEDSAIEDNSWIEIPTGEEGLVSAEYLVESSNGILSQVTAAGQQKFTYNCGVENCTRWYKSQSSLKAHVLTTHGALIEDCDKSSITATANVSSVTNMDYIMYTSPNAMAKGSNQMVMVEPGATIILNASPEAVACLPEPEPPPLNSNARISQSSYRRENSIAEPRGKRGNQGSARTALTREDVWKMKGKEAHNDTIAPVGASDVVLGTADLTEGLLLTEELPSMYYQDDMVGTECQILLLDSGTSENTINLRELE